MLTPQSPTPNAYTLAVSGRRPFVVVHSALLELLTPLEVQSVLGHELGHLKVGRTPSLAALIILEGLEVRVQDLCSVVGIHGTWHSMAQRCRTLRTQKDAHTAHAHGTCTAASAVRARGVAERGGAGVQRRRHAALHVHNPGGRAAALAARRGADLRPRGAAGGAGAC